MIELTHGQPKLDEMWKISSSIYNTKRAKQVIKLRNGLSFKINLTITPFHLYVRLVITEA